MAEQVLYRKYRPHTFDEVVGQEHIVKTLEATVKKGTPSHAYLFFGSRGIGKTSIARIFARELGTHENDTIEIDAASNRGIDDIRALRDDVRTLPFLSKYKVYIIDEVHMLTKEAFNALLKTLEEPPKHVVFILATTEIEKIPETIMSRCEIYTFKKPTDQILQTQVETIAKKEGFEISPDVAHMIALSGDGAFRDTLSALQKVINLSGKKKIDGKLVEDVLGIPEKTLVEMYIKNLLNADLEKALEVLHSDGVKNTDIKIFMKEVVYLFRLTLLARFSSKDFLKSEDISTERAEFIKEMVALKSKVLQSQSLLKILKAYDESRFALVPTLALEIATISILETVVID